MNITSTPWEGAALRRMPGRSCYAAATPRRRLRPCPAPHTLPLASCCLISSSHRHIRSADRPSCRTEQCRPDTCFVGSAFRLFLLLLLLLPLCSGDPQGREGGPSAAGACGARLACAAVPPATCAGRRCMPGLAITLGVASDVGESERVRTHVVRPDGQPCRAARDLHLTHAADEGCRETTKHPCMGCVPSISHIFSTGIPGTASARCCILISQAEMYTS